MSVEFHEEGDRGVTAVMSMKEHQKDSGVRLGEIAVSHHHGAYYCFTPFNSIRKFTCRELRQICDKVSELNMEVDKI